MHWPLLGLRMFGEARLPGRARALLAYALGLMAWWGGRQWLLGDWAPNSYRAKNSDERLSEVLDGLAYLGAAARDPGAAASLVALLVGLAAGGAARRIGLLALFALALLVVSGGDGYLGLRLFLPVGLLGLAAGALTLGRATRALRHWAAAVLLVAFATSTLRALPHVAQLPAMARAGAWEQADFACERAIATRLRSLELRVGHLHQQALSWFAPGIEVFDLSGLTDPEVARLPATGSITFGREALGEALERGVEVLYLDFARVRPWPYTSRDLTGWLNDLEARRAAFGTLRLDEHAERLVRDYTCASLPDLCGPGTYLNLLVRRDHADSLRRAGFDVRP